MCPLSLSMLSAVLALLLQVVTQPVEQPQRSEPSTPDWFLYALAIGAVAAGFHFFRSLSLQPEAQRFQQQRSTAAAAAKAIPPTPTSSMSADPNKAWTLAELKEFDGADQSKPLLLGCGGKVFDVSSARAFYGPGAGYGVFAGRDASRGLGRMEIEYKGADISDLSGSQQVTLQEVSDTIARSTPHITSMPTPCPLCSTASSTERWCCRCVV